MAKIAVLLVACFSMLVYDGLISFLLCSSCNSLGARKTIDANYGYLYSCMIMSIF